MWVTIIGECSCRVTPIHTVFDVITAHILHMNDEECVNQQLGEMAVGRLSL